MKKHLKGIQQKISGALSNKAGLFFLVIGILMTLFSAILIYSYVFSPEKIENILPEKNLVAFVSLSELEIPENIKLKDAKIQDKFDKFLSFYLGVDIVESNHWRGDRASVAIYNNSKNKSFDWIVLLEIAKQKEASDFLNTLASDIQQLQFDQKENLKIVNYLNRDLSCTFLEGYLVCTNKSSDFFDNYLDAKSGNQTFIANSSDYQRAIAQLPPNNWIKLYFLPNKAIDIFSNSAISLKPFIENIKSAVISVKESKNFIEFTIFALKENPDPEFSKNISDPERYKNLANLLPKNTLLFLQGKNTEDSIDYAFDQISLKDPAFKDFVLLRLRAIIMDYFGEELSLDNDIIPLLSDDFLVGITNDNSNNLIPFLVLRTDDEIFAEAKRQKLASGLEHMASKFAPNVVTYPLADNSEIKEVFPNNNALKRIEEDIADGIITFIIVNGEDDHSTKVALGRKKEILIISSDMDVVKDIIQKIDLPESRRDNSDLFFDFPIMTFSQFDELFGFSNKFFKYLPNQDFANFAENNLNFIEKVSGKIVRIPDSLRIEIKAEY